MSTDHSQRVDDRRRKVWAVSEQPEIETKRQDEAHELGKELPYIRLFKD
ncbi:hypothetical protein ECDEC2B_3072 [Escherichia coli DEC2B]|nr:hypothetical protein EC236275_3620 [Escherichia coli 2362-75]EHU08267.1 hypothetical protein ECDEC1A_2797 [Escherichia coli DEC1A]EHU09283.1 hypothetical protein ECDEC1C_3041 [Escherichia coli DEC1C]EHU11656.1 hypothetical protein ECDEC1B_2950 [Escherichia coli DEC1B]EHU28505.1 hypothetical protein ECDEC2A_3055 [Escherichia coli DEC2A]EHU38793.1 hypothetical protein ECDEC2B_3072 [Escherichia coli DEC2B]EHU55140.1 hypothetical protein ECDEC2E_2958 [Escherichia coli DEC2E]EHV55543.1 hypothe